jgi:hypothetical protein
MQGVISVRITETPGLGIIGGPAQLIPISYAIETATERGGLGKYRE